MTRVLLSAFDPFHGQSINPSQLSVQRLVSSGESPGGVELRAVFLPVVFGDAAGELARAVREHEPDIVICVGEAGGRFAVTPERFAVNLNDADFPDNAGNQPVSEPITLDCPVAYASTLPVAAMVEAMRAAGIPAVESSSAGNYVCNSVFYGLMHLIATERPQLRGGFVHVPFMHEQVLDRSDAPSLSIDTITDAVRIAVETAALALPRRSLTAVS